MQLERPAGSHSLDISKSLLAYLDHLSADPEQTAQLATRLHDLSHEIATRVPSWLSGSILLLTAQPQDFGVSVRAPGIDAAWRCRRLWPSQSPTVTAVHS